VLNLVIKLLSYACIIIILFEWIFLPEDIVGTKELAMLLVAILWHDLGRDE
jgi:hypothetical protein